MVKRERNIAVNHSLSNAAMRDQEPPTNTYAEPPAWCICGNALSTKLNVQLSAQ
jgi:hypothetical protein